MLLGAVELLYVDAGLEVHSKKHFDDRQATPVSIVVLMWRKRHAEVTGQYRQPQRPGGTHASGVPA